LVQVALAPVALGATVRATIALFALVLWATAGQHTLKKRMEDHIGKKATRAGEH